jgi:hypothetical protein
MSDAWNLFLQSTLVRNLMNLISWFQPQVPEKVQVEATKWIESMGEDLPLPDLRPQEVEGAALPLYEAVSPTALTRERREAFIVTCSQMAKNHFPLNKRSEANRQVVKKYIYDIMKERGMRPQHIRSSLPMAIALTFTRDEYDVEVEQFEQTDAYLKNNVETQYYAQSGWWPFRKRVTRKGYTQA